MGVAWGMGGGCWEASKGLGPKAQFSYNSISTPPRRSMTSKKEVFQFLVEEGAESLSNEYLCTLLHLECEEIASLAEENGETADYVIESIIEAAGGREELLSTEKERIRNYWMELTEVPGGTHFEIVVRCAEFLAKQLGDADSDISEIRQLANSSDWKERLIAAWYVRDEEGDEETEIKDLLKNDPFEDDNGIFLVREGAGFQED